MKKVLLIIAAVIFLAAGNAHAIVPTIDGLVTSLTEWDGSQLFGTDTPEADITDNWDLSAVYMKVIAGNGWFFRMDTFALPTYGGGPGSGGEQAFAKFFLDIDNNGTNDYLIDLNDRNYMGLHMVSVYGASPAFPEIGTAGTSNAISSIIELYVPDSLLSTDVFFDNAGNPFSLAVRLDGNGDEPDDKLPNSGYLKTPEPGSLMLVGFGLMGLIGGVIRRKFTA